jgi:hypothetical protein
MPLPQEKHPELPLPAAIPNGNLARLRAAFADPWRKPLLRVFLELAEAAFRTRGIPRYYVKHLLYRADAANWRDYLTPREGRRISSFNRNRSRIPFLENKLLFHYHFREADVRLPVCLGYSIGPVFFSDEGPRLLSSPDDLLRLGEALLSRTGSAGVFAKPIGGIHGKRCLRLDSASLQPEQVENYYADVCSGSFVFEEALVQHALLSSIYPHSVNTLRFITWTHRDGTIQVVSALLRLGASGSCTDNASAGGLFLKVDLESGALAPYARKFYEFGGTVHFAHPDTGFEFSDFDVPDFDSALEMTKVAAAHLPYCLVGWDVAITPDGPVLIEGNHNPHIYGAEIADGGYKKNPVFRAFLREVGIH